MAETAKLNKAIESIGELVKDPESRICLNIGGTKFMTTVATLSVDSDLFKVMFSAKFSDAFKTDEEYFFDRNPTLFPIILDFLRFPLREIDWSGMNEKMLTDLIFELEYYQVETFWNLARKQLEKLKMIAREKKKKIAKDLGEIITEQIKSLKRKKVESSSSEEVSSSSSDSEDSQLGFVESD